MPKLINSHTFVLFLLLTSSIATGQVGVNTDAPDASSMLDVVSDSKGILIPRVALDSTTDVLTIVSPIESLLVYNTATVADVTPGFYYWDGVWVRIKTLQNADWSLDGNAAGPFDFLGTTTAEPLRIRTGNTQRFQFTTSGQFAFANGEVRVGSLTTTTSGEAAVAVGADARGLAIGATAIGRDTFVDQIGGTAIGYGAQATGVNATSLGRNTTASGTRSIVVGYESTAAGTQAIALGRNATSNFSNGIALGPDAVTTKANQLRYSTVISEIDQGTATVVNTSDGRFKYDITENIPGLDFINLLRPVTYKFDLEKLDYFFGKEPTLPNTDKSYSGFIAQEVEAAASQLNYNFDGVIVPENAEIDNYKLSYQQFVVPLVQSVKELSTKVDQLEAENAQLKAMVTDITELKKYVSELKKLHIQTPDRSLQVVNN